MSEFTVRLEEGEDIVFSVIAPDGETIVHQCVGDDYNYHVDAEIAVNHYKDKCNLQLYRDKAKAQAKEVETLKTTVQGYRDDMKTIIDNAPNWTVDRIRRYCVEVLQGINKKENEG